MDALTRCSRHQTASSLCDSTVEVTTGTTLGMLAADGIAVFAGDRLTAIVPIRAIRWIAASLFFAFGAVAIAGALRIPTWL